MQESRMIESQKPADSLSMKGAEEQNSNPGNLNSNHPNYDSYLGVDSSSKNNNTHKMASNTN